MFLCVSAVSLLLNFLAATAERGQLASWTSIEAVSLQLQRDISVVNLKEFESASTIALQAGELTGYGILAAYLESSCTTFLTASIFPLNACVFYVGLDSPTNVMVTATSTTYSFAEFSDDACTTAAGNPEVASYTSQCTANKSKFLYQSSNQPPTAKATTSVR
jgi:hypothetical protein